MHRGNQIKVAPIIITRARGCGREEISAKLAIYIAALAFYDAVRRVLDDGQKCENVKNAAWIIERGSLFVYGIAKIMPQLANQHFFTALLIIKTFLKAKNFLRPPSLKITPHQ